jgi:hypothetical protein
VILACPEHAGAKLLLARISDTKGRRTRTKIKSEAHRETVEGKGKLRTSFRSQGPPHWAKNVLEEPNLCMDQSLYVDRRLSKLDVRKVLTEKGFDMTPSWNFNTVDEARPSLKANRHLCSCMPDVIMIDQEQKEAGLVSIVYIKAPTNLRSQSK